MKSFKQKGAKLCLFDRDWELNYTVNVIDELQDHFDINIGTDGIAPLKGDKFQDKDFLDNVAYIITALINEQLEIENESLTEKKPLYDLKMVKRRIGKHNWQEFYNVAASAYTLSWMDKDEDDIEETP